MTRDQFNSTFGLLSLVAAIASLAFATLTTWPNADTHKKIGAVVVGAWVLLPPIFFWIDWVKFRVGLSESEKEQAKHTHDLSRNIWLGLVIVLIVAFDLGGKFGV